jgi:hypothetical protein
VRAGRAGEAVAAICGAGFSLGAAQLLCLYKGAAEELLGAYKGVLPYYEVSYLLAACSAVPQRLCSAMVRA